MTGLLGVSTESSLNVLDKPVGLDWPGNFWAHWGIYSFAVVTIVIFLVMGFIWFERRLISRYQIRIGPNRCGPFGLLQPVADAVKVLLKEDIIPALADSKVHFLAPIVIFVPVLMMFAVIPFQDGVGLLPDLNIGIMFVVAIGSVETVGVFMAGWGSNNKYSLISAMRGVAQMLSYEIPMVLSLVAVLLVTQSLSMQQIVRQQSVPFILLLPLSFLIYFIGALAELQRTPFDLLEADSEIVAGYHIEYSGMKFAMFYLTEYGSALAVSAITTTVFLSGWKGPWLPPFVWFLVKVFAVFGLIIWIRATWPRIRIDQLMSFAWKFLLPLSLMNIVVVAIEVVIWPAGLPWAAVFLNLGIAAILLVAWGGVFRLRGGRLSET